MRVSAKVKDFISCLMQFYHQKLGAGFPLLLKLPCNTAPNTEDQRLHVEAQCERDAFRKFHINHTLLEEGCPCQCYFVTEAYQCLIDNYQVEEFQIAYKCGANLKVPLATITKKGESLSILQELIWGNLNYLCQLCFSKPSIDQPGMRKCVMTGILK